VRECVRRLFGGAACGRAGRPIKFVFALKLNELENGRVFRQRLCAQPLAPRLALVRGHLNQCNQIVEFLQ
jgi:hypothetical protein